MFQLSLTAKPEPARRGAPAHEGGVYDVSEAGPVLRLGGRGEGGLLECAKQDVREWTNRQSRQVGGIDVCLKELFGERKPVSAGEVAKRGPAENSRSVEQ